MSNKDEPLIVYKIKEFLSFFVDGTPKAIGHILSTIFVVVQLFYVGLPMMFFGLIPIGVCVLLNVPNDIATNVAWTSACLITLICYSSKLGERFVGEYHSPKAAAALIIGIITYVWSR